MRELGYRLGGLNDKVPKHSGLNKKRVCLISNLRYPVQGWLISYAVGDPGHIKNLASLNILQLPYSKMKLFHSYTARLKNLREFVRIKEMEVKHTLQRML